MGGIWKKDTGRGWGQTQQGYQMTILHIKNEKKSKAERDKVGERTQQRDTERVEKSPE